MIRSIATITVAPVRTALTTLQRAKDELSITTDAQHCCKEPMFFMLVTPATSINSSLVIV